MKEFIDKLISRLEQESDYEPIDYDYCDMSCSGEEHFIATHKAISIVNELAEEYNGKSNNTFETIYDKVCSLEKKYANDGNVESVNDCIKLENLLQYFKEELQSAEEYNGGWIPCERDLPKKYDYVYATCVSLIDDREPWVIEGYYSGLIGFDAMLSMPSYGEAKVVAWMPHKLPAPYTEGE